MVYVDLSKLNELRTQKNLTIKQLSELSGVRFGTLSKICSGRTDKPRAETLAQLAKALNVKVEDFTYQNWYNKENFENFSRKTSNSISKFFLDNPDGVKLANTLFDVDKSNDFYLQFASVFAALNQIKGVKTDEWNAAIAELLMSCLNMSAEDIKDAKAVTDAMRNIKTQKQREATVRLVTACSGKTARSINRYADAAEYLLVSKNKDE